MARFTDINYLELGKYMRELIKDPARIAKIKSGKIDIKEELKEYMTPRGQSWDDITIVPHFDEARTVHISFPFTGDVEESVGAIATGEEYKWPDHYLEDPSEPEATEELTIEKRDRLYHCRIGDYVMARCK